MIALLSLLGGARGIISAIAGAGLAFTLFAGWNTVWDNPRVLKAGKEQGAQEERLLWEEARRKLLAQMEQARKDAQAKVDAAELEYFNSRTDDALKIAALEDAIKKAEADDANPACPPRPAIPGGVSIGIDEIGR